MRTPLLVFGFCVSSIVCLNVTTYLNENSNWNLVDTEFSKFYLKNGSAINSSIEKDDLYFPKCCPPDYQYDPAHHKCLKNVNSSPVYKDLHLEVNLIGNQLQECEVIVDYVLSNTEFLQQVKFSQTTLILKKEDRFQLGQYCLDKDYSEKIVLRLCYSHDYCLNQKSGHKRCIKKCCPEGYYYYMSKCKLNPTIGINMSVHEDVIRNVYGKLVSLFSIYHY